MAIAERIKYPRTKHLPWSQGVSDDDLVIDTIEVFHNLRIVVTEKMDGENTTLYRDYIHARSLEPCMHASQDWVKGFHAGIRHLIPPGWRICGENLYAHHSIAYQNLDSYFYIFSIWDEKNTCLGWDETHQWVQRLNAGIPQVFYNGIWDEEAIRAIAIDTKSCEGYVVRPFEKFPFDRFDSCVAKFVRGQHVNSNEHWMHKKIVPNKLRKQA